MVTLEVPQATATRMWALPGAMMTERRRPRFVDGRLVRDELSPVTDMPCPSFLIEHRRGLVLFDSGVSPRGLADPDRYFPDLVNELKFECRPELGVDAQIRTLGYRLDQVDYVIPSHLHFDHAGGLFLFPAATFFVGAGERAFAHQPPEAMRRYFLSEDLVPTRDFTWHETDGDLDLFGDGSVHLLYSPGHTPGSLALFVRLPSRNVILSGDVCHYREEITHGTPDTLYDEAAGGASLSRLIWLRDNWDASIWIGHDLQDWREWPHAPDSIE